MELDQAKRCLQSLNRESMSTMMLTETLVERQSYRGSIKVAKQEAMRDIKSNNSDGGETIDYDKGTENLELLLRFMEESEKQMC